MIRLLRVDDAFIHGRVALIWSKKLKLNKIMIINDELMNDDFMRVTLELAKPRNVGLEFISFSNFRKKNPAGIIDRRSYDDCGQ